MLRVATIISCTSSLSSFMFYRPKMAKLLLLVVSLSFLGFLSADFASDRAECTDQLIGLSTCLTYVESTATAKGPTPDCCSGLQQVLSKSMKCLCVLVKDRNEPSLGFKINATRALSLPSSCQIPANTTHCLDLLKMDPNSKEAAIFKQGGSATQVTSPSPSDKGNNGHTSTHPSGCARNSDYFVGRMMRWFGMKTVGVLCFSSLIISFSPLLFTFEALLVG